MYKYFIISKENDVFGLFMLSETSFVCMEMTIYKNIIFLCLKFNFGTFEVIFCKYCVTMLKILH